MTPPGILQELLNDQESGRPQKALSLTILTWQGSCISFADGWDDEKVGIYSQQGIARPLRLVGWSDEHSALIYEPVSSVRFEYTRADLVGPGSSSETYYGALAGDPAEHGPLFAVHASTASPYENMRRSPPFRFSIFDYTGDSENRLPPEDFFKSFAMLRLPDLAAEDAARANNTHDQEEPQYKELYESWLEDAEPDSDTRLGWSGPWARELISLSAQRPTPPLGTMTTVAWKEDFGVKKDFGIELSLETVGVHAEDLFDMFGPEDSLGNSLSSSIREFKVIDRYTIRATVLRVFVKPSYFSPTMENQGPATTSPADEHGDHARSQGSGESDDATTEAIGSLSKKRPASEVEEESQEPRSDKRRKPDDAKNDA